MRPAIRALTPVFLLVGALAHAQALQLELPVACRPGADCIVQNYVDQEPGPERRDYRCGHLTYDGHKGTDIRVLDAEAYRRGVPVLAAAPGVVRAIRDGMADRSLRAPDAESVAKRESGNAVVVRHADGWETQYAHLRKDSVAVRAGDKVEAGQVLGMVGLSGNTEFPHLHFEVRHRGRTVDPFVGTGGGTMCALGREPLWSAGALTALAYVATGLLDAGIAGGRVRFDDAHTIDRERTPAFGADAQAAVFWVQVFGAQAGDVQELRIVAPGGRVLAARRSEVPRPLAQSSASVGARRTSAAWPPGTYRGEYVLTRGGERILSVSRDLVVAP